MVGENGGGGLGGGGGAGGGLVSDHFQIPDRLHSRQKMVALGEVYAGGAFLTTKTPTARGLGGLKSYACVELLWVALKSRQT